MSRKELIGPLFSQLDKFYRHEFHCYDSLYLAFSQSQYVSPHTCVHFWWDTYPINIFFKVGYDGFLNLNKKTPLHSTFVKIFATFYVLEQTSELFGRNLSRLAMATECSLSVRGEIGGEGGEAGSVPWKYVYIFCIPGVHKRAALHIC